MTITRMVKSDRLCTKRRPLQENPLFQHVWNIDCSFPVCDPLTATRSFFMSIFAQSYIAGSCGIMTVSVCTFAALWRKQSRAIAVRLSVETRMPRTSEKLGERTISYTDNIPESRFFSGKSKRYLKFRSLKKDLQSCSFVPLKRVVKLRLLPNWIRD